ncbi:hypothetical protein MCOR27_009308 [Pyricularia oryzae]|uniref:Velvet domain-containing protein n=2 Tax=Pyricularia TaxID=48558 RepID=A0ABQ8N8F1_PYRGI|nr:hypothetical protein MCOR01_000101 [Pyricularia oryzae]KAI6292568.1 hypothetical protein MCOR33_009761 [Pyricularia grisea]KAH9428195.1 hypothetical protein MCOR02_011683 [Pyricularia oryzae]KAI6263000.1 hypothetical protein MCOR19_000813 [Pyricularia oryzae]KAI6270414.1 hypothetical protein MCOR27_009308 [Pyricularia oryzae]
MSGEEIIGEFTVQPVPRALPCTALPPMVVRIGDYSPGTDAIQGMCVLLDHNGNNTLQDVPSQHGPLDSIFDTTQGAGLQCHASTPTCPSKLSSRSDSGSSGSSSSSSGASGEEKSIYFAFTNIAITWPGTYTVGVYVWIYPTPTKEVPQPEPYIAGKVVSELIEVLDGTKDPEERPRKEERRILNRMRHITGMNHFNIPHQ